MNTFAALADPTRRRIVEAIALRPRTVTQIVEQFEVSQPAISQHLRVLREASLVRVVPAGKSRVYHLNPAPLKAMDDWLGPYRRFWADKLDALEAHMDEEPNA